MDILQDIQPMTKFRNRSKEFLQNLRETKRPLILTVNGEAAAVVQDADSYRRLLDLAASAENSAMAPSPEGVTLDEQTRQRLEALARVKDRSPHWLICTALALYLDREERCERETREDMARWEQYQLTGEAISHDDANAWLGALAQGLPSPRPGTGPGTGPAPGAGAGAE